MASAGWLADTKFSVTISCMKIACHGDKNSLFAI